MTKRETNLKKLQQGINQAVAAGLALGSTVTITVTPDPKVYQPSTPERVLEMLARTEEQIAVKPKAPAAKYYPRPLSDLPILEHKERIINILTHAGSITCIQQLCQLTEQELIKVPHLGPTFRMHIEAALSRLGKQLRRA